MADSYERAEACKKAGTHREVAMRPEVIDGVKCTQWICPVCRVYCITAG